MSAVNVGGENEEPKKKRERFQFSSLFRDDGEPIPVPIQIWLIATPTATMAGIWGGGLRGAMWGRARASAAIKARGVLPIHQDEVLRKHTYGEAARASAKQGSVYVPTCSC